MSKKGTTRSGQATAAADTRAENTDVVRGATIRVRATQVGFYDDIRRRIGDVFDLHPRRGTFTQLVRDDAGKPVINREVLVPHRVTEEVEDVELTAEQQFSKKWMVKVSKNTAPRASTAAERIQAEHDSILRSRLSGNSARPADQVSASGVTAGEIFTGDLNVLDGHTAGAKDGDTVIWGTDD